MEGNINELVNQIAEYLGCTADTILQYLPQYIAKNIAGYQLDIIYSVIWTIIGIIIMLVSFIIHKKISKKTSNLYDSEGLYIARTMLLVIGGLISLIAVLTLFSNIYNLYMWTNFPEVSAAEHIWKIIN